MMAYAAIPQLRLYLVIRLHAFRFPKTDCRVQFPFVFPPHIETVRRFSGLKKLRDETDRNTSDLSRLEEEASSGIAPVHPLLCLLPVLRIQCGAGGDEELRPAIGVATDRKTSGLAAEEWRSTGKPLDRQENLRTGRDGGAWRCRRSLAVSEELGAAGLPLGGSPGSGDEAGRLRAGRRRRSSRAEAHEAHRRGAEHAVAVDTRPSPCLQLGARTPRRCHDKNALRSWWSMEANCSAKG
ncbi:hypothetical protein KSP39_PZI003324 [Platanthera zijinensis]|uniref:Uncharacterized protein n=1 Tax=Platanthera zijinensis TaxID=2320716 RepID=A0AAP0BWJ7_9ASPA